MGVNLVIGGPRVSYETVSHYRPVSRSMAAWLGTDHQRVGNCPIDQRRTNWSTNYKLTLRDMLDYYLLVTTWRK